MATAANGSAFTPAEVRKVRADAAAGKLQVREWADAKGVSLETVRRVARRDTYRDIPDESDTPLQGDSPTAEEIAASLARLRSVASSLPPQPREIDSLLDALASGKEPPP